MRTVLNLALLATTPWLTGFVLLSSHKATLPVTPESPELAFVWNGSAPSIEDKDEFMDGKYEDLDDKAFMLQLLTEAMGIWNRVPGAYVTLGVSEGSALLDEEDGQFSIVVEKSDNLTSSAFAKPFMDDEAPEVIRDCDISIADKKVRAESLAFTIAHELGHCLGLGHAHTNYSAMMGYSRMDQKLKLGADDMAGAIYLYPDPAVVDGEPKELVCGTVTGRSGGAAGLASLLLLFFPLAAAAVRSGMRPVTRSR